MKLRKYFLGLLKQTEDKENVDNQENGSGSQEQVFILIHFNL